MEGHCQCGHIKFTTPLPQPLKIYICHCTHCRAQSASTYGLTAIFPSFDIPSPDPSTPLSDHVGTWTRSTRSGNQLECLFCRRCGVRLMHRVVGGEKLSVKAGCLEGLGKEMLKGAEHIWVKEAVVDVPERDGEGNKVVRWEEEPMGGSFNNKSG